MIGLNLDGHNMVRELLDFMRCGNSNRSGGIVTTCDDLHAIVGKAKKRIWIGFSPLSSYASENDHYYLQPKSVI